MINYCINHNDRKASHFCIVCKNYFCHECLSEGNNYYYCHSEDCQRQNKNDLEKDKIQEYKSDIPNNDRPMRGSDIFSFGFFNLGFRKLNWIKYRDHIEQEMQNGYSKSEIFNKLKSEIDDSLHDELAFIINSSKPPKIKSQYLFYNFLIISFIFILLLSNFVDLLSSSHNLESVIGVIVFSYVLYALIKMRPRAYYFVIAISIIQFIYILSFFSTISSDSDTRFLFSILIILISSNIFLAHLVKRNVYPDHRYRGPLKDENNQYIFTD